MTKNPLRRWFGRNESVTELGARQSKKEENDANTGNHSSGGDTGPTIRALKGDIASQGCDVVVNAANERLGNGAGVAGAIIKAAGPGLLRECADRYPDGCPTGEARITGGHDLPAKWIVHTVGPQWSDGTNGEPELLADCYRNSLQAAAEIGARTVAFPAILTGSFHYPREDAARVAVSTIRKFLTQSDHGINEVILVAYDCEQLTIYERFLEAEGDE
jgi:O-acetyl-ADP-ribose deacetylase (regulator of RNase III)